MTMLSSSPDAAIIEQSKLDAHERLVQHLFSEGHTRAIRSAPNGISYAIRLLFGLFRTIGRAKQTPRGNSTKVNSHIPRTRHDYTVSAPAEASLPIMKTSTNEISADGNLSEPLANPSAASLWFESDPLAQFVLALNGQVLEQNRAARTLIQANLAIGLAAGQLVSTSDSQPIRLPSIGQMQARENNHLALLEGGQTGSRLLLSMRLFGETLPDGPYFALSAHQTADYLAPEKLVAALDDAFLTPAEFQVALALFQAPNSEEMSDFLGISIHTVNTHLKRIFRKVRVNSKQDLILHVLRRLVPV